MIKEFNEGVLESMTMGDLVGLKEYFRQAYGLYIENNMEQWGPFDRERLHFTTTFAKHIPHPRKNGMKQNAKRSYQTFNSYRKALIFCLKTAHTVDKQLDEQGEKNRKAVQKLMVKEFRKLDKAK